MHLANCLSQHTFRAEHSLQGRAGILGIHPAAAAPGANEEGEIHLAPVALQPAASGKPSHSKRERSLEMKWLRKRNQTSGK